ncbi:hypothetical protein [Phaeocystidibacter luteus]|uniref:Uncharacterized protein n=1 Tax=Phaeocystidibacter luteus TaxID=911197 RepID=A0A6N6RJD0_9FLAO|nr:hypothetical protein [Phaeocystidibacter luteus]KAB2807045.1 hypothetical protein F8C67_12690 [Phaeocystidibacter luteus]
MANGSMISKAEAKALVDRFKANPTKTTNACQAMLYDLTMIEQLKGAAPEGTITAVRVYFGMNEDFSLCTVLVGCDSAGNNYYGAGDDMCLDYGTRCPSDCGDDTLGS